MWRGRCLQFASRVNDRGACSRMCRTASLISVNRPALHAHDVDVARVGKPQREEDLLRGSVA